MRKVWVTLLTTLMLLFVLVPPALAIGTRFDTRTYVGKDETINDDLVLAGDSVVIDGTVNGDVFAFAESVIINGRIDGNLVTAGNTVEVRGTVTGTVFGAANVLTVDGRIERSFLGAGSTVTITRSGTVSRSVFAAGDQLNHLGSVGRGMAIAGSRARIDGQVGQELQAGIDRLTIESGAVINGPVTYTSEREAVIAKNARIGKVTWQLPDVRWSADFDPWFTSAWWIALKFGGFLAVGMAVLALFPGMRDRFPHLLIRKAWQAPLAGFLALLAIPVAAIILLLTIVGIPLSLITFLLFPAVIYVSQIYVSWAVGRLLADQIEPLRNQAWPLLFLLGALLTTVAVEVPFVGILVAMATVFYGLGGLFFAFVERGAR